MIYSRQSFSGPTKRLQPGLYTLIIIIPPCPLYIDTKCSTPSTCLYFRSTRAIYSFVPIDFSTTAPRTSHRVVGSSAKRPSPRAQDLYDTITILGVQVVAHWDMIRYRRLPNPVLEITTSAPREKKSIIL